MKKEQIALIILVIVVVSGALILKTKSGNPENKVAKLEQTIVDQKETSGYNACMKKVDEKMKKYDECTTIENKETSDKLAAKGYTDGLDCIQQPEDPICQNKERYNAEVDVSNKADINYSNCTSAALQMNDLSQPDCMKLLENK